MEPKLRASVLCDLHCDAALGERGENCCAAHNNRYIPSNDHSAPPASNQYQYHGPCCSPTCTYGCAADEYSTEEELYEDDEEDSEDIEDDEEYEISIPAPSCPVPSHSMCGKNGSSNLKHSAGHWCCLHSQYLYDHYAESTREKLRSKLNIRAPTPETKPQTVKRPVEDERSLDELLSFIHNTKKAPPRGVGKDGGPSSAENKDASSAAKARKKQRKRERKMREREERERKEREEQERKEQEEQERKEKEHRKRKKDNKNNPSNEKSHQSSGVAKPDASSQTTLVNDKDEDSSNGPAMPPEESGEGFTEDSLRPSQHMNVVEDAEADLQDAVGGVPGGGKLAAKMAQFSEFPHFWEEEDDLDPNLKAEQDREVEEFRRRLESIHVQPVGGYQGPEEAVLSPRSGLAEKRKLNNGDAVTLSRLCQKQISMKKVKQNWKNGMSWKLGQTLSQDQLGSTQSDNASSPSVVNCEKRRNSNTTKSRPNRNSKKSAAKRGARLRHGE